VNWTLILCVLGLTVPPSAAYVASLLVQWRIERSKELSKQHEQVLLNQEQTQSRHDTWIEHLRNEVAEHTKQISLLTERI
jgi:hypothetical protein